MAKVQTGVVAAASAMAARLQKVMAKEKPFFGADFVDDATGTSSPMA